MMIFESHLPLKRQSALSHDESHVLPSRQQGTEPRHRITNFIFRRVFGNHHGCDIHHTQQRQRHFPLKNMLRLVMHTGFASPAHDENHRNAIHLVVQKTCRRIDDVAFTAVLQVDHRRFSCRQMVARRQRRGVSFIGGNHVMLRVFTISCQAPIGQGL